ncbi:MAG: tetratricopeptide repeat protein [Aureliella sp.]
MNNTATERTEKPQQPDSWSRKQMEKALAHHQASRFGDAERYYRQVLRLEPDEADANNLLGVLLFQTKRAEEGLAFLKTATSLKPAEAMFFYNYATALRAAGKPQEAVNAFSKCVELDPKHSDAQNALVDLLLKHKNYDAAIAQLNRIVNARPGDAAGFKKLGEALHAKKKHAEAAKVLRRACDLSPGDAAMQHQLGLCLQAAGERDAAIDAYRKSLELKEDLAAAHNNLAIVLADKGDTQEAVTHYERALQLKPDLFQTRCNLGGLLRKNGDLDSSIKCLEEAVKLRSDCAEAWCNLGNTVGDSGAVERALDCYTNALLCKPDYAQAHLNRSLALLRREDFENGWVEYEWRSKLKECPRRHTSKPRWNGRVEPGMKLLVHVEQGLGDTFQMVRYAKKLHELGAEVIIECQKPLVSILSVNDVASHVFPMGEKPPQFELQIPLMSLPSVMWKEHGFCYGGPYLSPAVERVQAWKPKLSAIKGKKIGIAWQGNPEFKQDHSRSVPLAAFQPLIENHPDAAFISLQKMHGLDQLEKAPFKDRIEVFEDLDETAGAFMDTAAVMSQLDFLVTSDSAIAHLAGGMGVRTYLVLPFAADWRWFIDRTDCPWYPTLKILRQPDRGEWAPLFDEIARDLFSVHNV